MKKPMGRVISSVVMMLGAWCIAAPVVAEQLVEGSEVGRAVRIRDLEVGEGRISGILVNETAKTIRDVRFLIRNDWIWDDEESPGEESPGRSTYEVLREAVPPYGKVPFSFPLPVGPRSDGAGRFAPSIEPVGFEEIG